MCRTASLWIGYARATCAASGTHREHALLAGDGHDRVVALGSAGSGVDEYVDGLVEHRCGRDHGEHVLDVRRLEDLLVGVEGQPAQLALDEVGAVLHDGLEFDVPVRALPAGHQVQHVHARGGLAFLDALLACQLDADRGEQGQPGDLVPHPEQPRVEVDLGRQGRDRDQTGVADQQEGGHRLVEEARLDVRCLLEHDEIPSGPLGRRNLRVCGCI